MTTTTAPSPSAAQRSVGSPTKTFVLDTNVLIHAPNSIFNFADNNVVIPGAVLEELDRMKGEQDSQRGRNAREVHRLLIGLFPDRRSMEEGVGLPNGGKLLICSGSNHEKIWQDNPAVQSVLADRRKADNVILLTALHFKASFPPPVILVTKDINVALKARAIGLEAQDYQNDKVPEGDSDDAGYATVEVPPQALQCFASTGEVVIEGDDVVAGLAINDYVLLQTAGEKTMPGRYYGEGIVRRLKLPEFVKAEGGIAIRPKNLEQQFLLDALLDPAISLVTCFGKAGTGKTILSLVAALHQVREDTGTYDGVSISRPVISLGKDIGFLPGSIEEKMRPWLQPYYDACEVAMPSRRPKDPQFAAKREGRGNRKGKAQAAVQLPAGPNGAPPLKPHERLIKQGVLEIEVLAFIRGRSIPRRFYILDEAQQLTPHEVKTVVSRMSVGSKIVLLGDPAQIDNPYVDARSNGLVYCRNKMRGKALAGHVKLNKGERSPLAEAAADLL